jgi:hypothetical protein
MPYAFDAGIMQALMTLSSSAGRAPLAPTACAR